MIGGRHTSPNRERTREDHNRDDASTRQSLMYFSHMSAVKMSPKIFRIFFRFIKSWADYLDKLLVGSKTRLVSQSGRPRLTPSMIPDLPDFVVKESSFFNKWRVLPSPKQVREKATAQWVAGTALDKRKVLTYGGKHEKPPLAVFEDLGLVVKWGVQVMISEAQSAYAVHSLLKDRVPVPEIYGWRTDGEEKFIYMQYIHGQTLEKAWDSLQNDEREAVSLQLHDILKNLRQLEQDPADTFIGWHISP